MGRYDYSLDSAKSTVRASVACALAQALITGIDNAEQEGHRLSQLQQIDLATMHIMAFTEAIEATRRMDVDQGMMKAAGWSVNS